MQDRLPRPLHERFIDTAWKLGSAGGYGAVKIRAISEVVGVSGALLYSYFEDKAALMDELRARGCAVLEIALEQALQQASAHGAVDRLCRAYLDYMREHAWLYLGESKRELVGPKAPHAQALIRRLAKVLDPSGAMLEPVHNTALHLWLALQGVVALMRALGQWDRPFVDAHLQLVLHGMLPGSRAGRGRPAELVAVTSF
jgi:AcrR family transcriptional regulator